MRRDDLCDILSRIPPTDLTKTVLTLRFGTAVTLDSVLRQEAEYLVVRGREAGTNDEGRVFFVPFEDVLCLKIDRVMKAHELKRMYGEKVEEDGDAGDLKPDGKAEAAKPDLPPAQPAAPMDPASIAKQNLLARIRAARTGTKMPGG
jgi:hypothetical protein